ncbi:type II toxin-antitoxin system RelE/ParE family toxin [Roseimicrobium sp. ORNL1]|uniref:type II toxin-antitoxin system RelE/ParE family toxin n=1 Tax=Roseimicrobium sp. ORNL1 TaxID=2711231 RepID=UPI0013E138DC|nr:type II toxin-antitoxin system RelE/ParE family toxin [Roseimicrobium sp. ORNL1]QIF01374.1 type II toxin-antitoxin system RelE/ParE family toxin [Roseimicrobium sp. ORNL1]
MKVAIANTATFHIEEACEFYDNQESGAGRYFLQCLAEDLDRLATLGGVHSKRLKHYHKTNCSHHPFAIYYTIDGETVTIKAVLDSRKNPVAVRRILSRIKRQNS